MDDGLIMTLAIAFTLIYMVPSVIAFGRNTEYAVAIILVNLLLGWTVLGWIWALIWALDDAPKREATRQNYVPRPKPTCPNCSRTVGWRVAKCPHCNYHIARRRMKFCPYCGEEILFSATICRYCQSKLRN